jgi:hypothetical protein
MFHIIYLSSALRPFTREELQQLLVKSRQNNLNLHITGILFYKDGNFLQSIEGEESVVRELFSKIRKDERHRGIMPLFQEDKEGREFANWSMAFRDLNNTSEHVPEGFNDILNTDLAKMGLSGYSAKVKAFMKMFSD